MYLDIKSSKIYTVVDKPLKLYGILSILMEPVPSKPVKVGPTTKWTKETCSWRDMCTNPPG